MYKYLLIGLLFSQPLYADWLLEGNMNPSPIEDIKGEIGSDMKFGIIKGLFSSIVTTIDPKANTRIKQTEQDRNQTAIASGIAIAETMKLSGSVGIGVIAKAKTTAQQIENLTREIVELKKADKAIEAGYKAGDKTLEAADKAIEAGYKAGDKALQSQINSINAQNTKESIKAIQQQMRSNAIIGLGGR